MLKRKNREKNRDIGEARYEPKTALFSKKNTQKTTNFAFQGLFYYKEALGMIRTFISSLSIETIKGSGFVAYKFFLNWLRVPDRVAGGFI